MKNKSRLDRYGKCDQLMKLFALIFQNLLAGAIFGIWAGFPLVCFLTACGATFCYLLSRAFGKVLLLEFFPDRLQALQVKVGQL